MCPRCSREPPSFKTLGRTQDGKDELVQCPLCLHIFPFGDILVVYRWRTNLSEKNTA